MLLWQFHEITNVSGENPWNFGWRSVCYPEHDHRCDHGRVVFMKNNVLRDICATFYN